MHFKSNASGMRVLQAHSELGHMFREQRVRNASGKRVLQAHSVLRFKSNASAASSARRRVENPKKAAPLTAEQQKEKRDERQLKQARIDAYVEKWREDTNNLANTMAAEFDLKPRYFLDIFFQGGAHMITHQNALNPYNAFKNLKAAEAHKVGDSKSVTQLHTDHFEEYEALTPEEKTELVQEFEKTRTRNFQLRRDTPRARVQDVANVVCNMKMLALRVFFCVVKNNVDFKMEPEWYFTSKELETYMEIATQKRWVTGEVGMRLEAFVIAGCDPVNMLRTSAQKVNYMKGEIRAELAKNLSACEVSGVPDARIGWTWFEEDVVQRYGVKLVGWTAGKDPVDPSNLSTSQSVICTLLTAIRNGECCFKKLGPTEAAERRKKWEEDIAAGRVTAKHRASRCDAGQPHKRVRDDSDNDSDDNDGEADDGTACPPPTKRARTTQTIPASTKPCAKKATPKKKAATTKKATPAKKKATPAKKAHARKVASRAIITSDDERDDDDPHANESDAAGSSALVVDAPPPPA
ncbi:hypothetical protein B0H14DRAFT_2630594 [Mycena olivaceomarginata]|nr:hypothetical protein B0H14DRAFT_2630594 [Mycena olivaceomarginata]